MWEMIGHCNMMKCWWKKFIKLHKLYISGSFCELQRDRLSEDLRNLPPRKLAKLPVFQSFLFFFCKITTHSTSCLTLWRFCDKKSVDLLAWFFNATFAINLSKWMSITSQLLLFFALFQSFSYSFGNADDE